MKEYKIVQEKTELFLEPIPRWITSYGFITMLFLAISILVSSYYFKIPRSLSTKVHISKESAFMILSFEESLLIRDSSIINISSPFHHTPIKGNIDKAMMWAEGSKVYIPILIDAAIIRNMPFKKELSCEGEILIDNTSLFQKVFIDSTIN